MKNIKYGLSLKRTNASLPKAFDADVSVDLPLGGVFGKAKLKSPSAIEAPAAI